MQLKQLFQKKASRFQIFPKTRETVTRELMNVKENNSSLERKVDIDNTKTDKIYLMDMTSDRQWICYVSQYEDDSKSFVTTLSVRKFTAISDEISREEGSTTIFGDDSSILHEIRVHMEENLQLPMKSVNINQYFNKTDPSHKFLSISSDGQYISLSTYDEKKKDIDGSCLIFLVEADNISFQHELKCNGRAVFLDRENGLCLAIINTVTLKIYEKINNFSKKLSYNVYDLTSFGSSNGDFQNSRFQYFYTDFIANWVVSKNPQSGCRSYKAKMRHIIALSAYIKSNILITPFTEKSDTIRLWSLKNNGIRLSTIAAPGDAIIAISEDFKFAATANSKVNINIYNLENGCLVYTMRSQIPISKLTHATFCYNSRYLALSSVKKCENDNASAPDENMAIFDVWYIEGERSIYSTMKNLGLVLPGTLNRTEIKSLKPFISEEITKGNRRVLKGYYTYVDPNSIAITRCLELKIDDQRNSTIHWLSKKSSPQTENNENNDDDISHSEFDLFSENSSVVAPSENIIPSHADTYFIHDKPSACTFITCINNNFNVNLLDELSHDRLNQSLDKLLDEYVQGKDYNCYEITDSINDYEHLKCGFIEDGNDKYLVRCGKHMIQLWKLAVISLENDTSEIQKNRLVYIKSYTNSDYRSFYLSPNIWRIESFKSIKFIGGSSELRIIMNIVEDDRFFSRERKNNLASYTEEFFLPIRDNSFFNFHKFEGACQTLYYLNIFSMEKSKMLLAKTGVHEKYQKTLETLVDENNRLVENTIVLIKAEINKLDKNCNSFKTVAGSKILAMLASFEQGRLILTLLLKNEDVTFNVSSYSVTAAYGAHTINLAESSRYNTTQFKVRRAKGLSQLTTQVTYRSLSIQTMKKQYFKVMNENVLMLLIRECQYNLYHLMLNRILSDSKKSGPECLILLKDVLLLLQELKNTDQLEKTSEKFTCLAIKIGTAGFLLPSEIEDIISEKANLRIEENFVVNVGSMHYFAAMEQISKLRPRNLEKILDDFFWTTFNMIWAPFRSVIKFFKDSNTKPSSQFVTCVVPLPYLNTYYRTTARDAFLAQPNTVEQKIDNSVRSPYKKESTFLQIALNQHSEPNIWKQGDDVMAVLLQYKWRAFIRKRFYYIFTIHIIYYVSYCTGVQFALEKYNYDSANAERSIVANSEHLASVILFCLSGVALCSLEISQIPKSRKFINYFKSWYNYVDIAAIVFPFITFIQLTQNLNYFYEVSSVCTLIIWLHGIVRLRVFSSFGIALETIIQLFRKVISVLLILLLVVFGFTHSFIVLLRQQEDQYFQENYGGETSIPLSDESPAAGETVLYNLSTSNGFSDPFKAFYQVWLFIFGVWDPVTSGDSGDNQMLFVLCMIFAFITVLIFTNMIIALMSSTVEEVKRQGKKVWMTHFAEVIAEIENITTESTRHDRENNPAFIFYSANYEKVKIHEEKLQQETQELRRVLKMDEIEQIKVR